MEYIAIRENQRLDEIRDQQNGNNSLLQQHAQDKVLALIFRKPI